MVIKGIGVHSLWINNQWINLNYFFNFSLQTHKMVQFLVMKPFARLIDGLAEKARKVGLFLSSSLKKHAGNVCPLGTGSSELKLNTLSIWI